MKKKLFQFAALWHEPKNEPGKALEYNTQIIVHPTTVLAVSEEVARVAAARLIPEAYQEKLEQIEIIVGAF
jgi:hypothetical protein